MLSIGLFFLMIRLPPRSTRTDTLFPYTTLFRSPGSRVFSDYAFYQGPAMGLRLGPPGEQQLRARLARLDPYAANLWGIRSEEHTSELQSLMRISYAVFCLKKKKTPQNKRMRLTYTDK